MAQSLLTIPFHVPYTTGEEVASIQQAIVRNQASSDGFYTQLLSERLQSYCQRLRTLMTTSCTHA